MVKKLKVIEPKIADKNAFAGIFKIYGDKINEMIDEQERFAVDIAKTNVEVTKMVNIVANMTNNPTLVEDDYKLPGVDNIGDPGTAVESHKKKSKIPKKEDSPF